MDSTSPDLLGEFAADRLLLGRSSTVQRVADVLRGRIAAGALRSGTRLSEEALGAALGVSRNTLREAFRVLAHERLVVHEMNRGVFVRSLGPADVADIYLTRRALETAGVRAAAGSSRLAGGAGGGGGGGVGGPATGRGPARGGRRPGRGPPAGRPHGGPSRLARRPPVTATGPRWPTPICASTVRSAASPAANGSTPTSRACSPNCAWRSP
ncbi:GntR family transcriptional regulator [Streptomyces sp. NPDC054933]